MDRFSPLRGGLPLPQGDCHSLDEVANGGLGHPMQESAIKGLANQSERRLVSSAQPELGQVHAKSRDFELTFERWEDSARPGSPPGDWQPSAAGCANGGTELDLDALANLKPTNRETDVGEQLVAVLLGR